MKAPSKHTGSCKKDIGPDPPKKSCQSPTAMSEHCWAEKCSTESPHPPCSIPHPPSQGHHQPKTRGKDPLTSQECRKGEMKQLQMIKNLPRYQLKEPGHAPQPIAKRDIHGPHTMDDRLDKAAYPFRKWPDNCNGPWEATYLQTVVLAPSISLATGETHARPSNTRIQRGKKRLPTPSRGG